MVECPSDETLAALGARRLDPAELDRVTAHLDVCATCQAAVIATVRSAGTRFGRYEVREMLGAGGMGRVYRAYDAELDRDIALKVLRPELVGGHPELVDRLVRESRIMAKVVHPAVVTVHDVGRDEDAVFIAMELVRGETLGAHLARTRRSWRAIVRLFERAGEGLAAAHRAGVIHRDFKPENVLVDSELDRVVVTDFGIARTLSEALPGDGAGGTRGDDVRLTATGVAIGTPAYMAPEQLAGKPVDVRADVFAFSVSLWEALFARRPFPGNTIAEIRAAMLDDPMPSRVVPRRLLRTLQRGLARDPDERWSTMDEMLRALSGVRARRVRAQVALGGIALVAASVTGALLWSRPRHIDRCAAALEPVSAAYSAQNRAALAAMVGERDRAQFVKELDDRFASWRATHLATCKSDREPIQAALPAACLEARRTELVGYVADALADPGPHAASLAGILPDPALCAAPPPGLLSPRFPADPTLREKVRVARYALIDAEDARDRGDYAVAQKLAEDVLARSDLWPPVRAEATFTLSTIEEQGGNQQRALELLHQCAALAEKEHVDLTAVNCWVQLVLASSFLQGDPARGLEYISYAEAAGDRIGRPPDVEALLAYAKGAALIDADRKSEAEVALRRAVQLAETSAPYLLVAAIQGLGVLYEDLGRFEDAAAAYRRAIGKQATHGPPDPQSSVVLRERLASALAKLGKASDAEAEARDAVAIADRSFDADSPDRSFAHVTLAQVLTAAGKRDEALAEIRPAVTTEARIYGARNARYGETLAAMGEILVDAGHPGEAEHDLAQACEILQYALGDGASTLARCWTSHARALGALQRPADAVALLERAIPVFVKVYGHEHPDLAIALLERGRLERELHRDDAALDDLEAAIAQLEKQQIDPGRVATARWLLARQLWSRDPARARTLLDDALARLEHASGAWTSERAQASAWKARHR